MTYWKRQEKNRSSCRKMSRDFWQTGCSMHFSEKQFLIVERGIATPEDVDTAIKYGFGMRLGVMAPMEVIDSGGIDSDLQHS